MDPSSSNNVHRLTNGDDGQSQELFPENRSIGRSYGEPNQESGWT